jgi:hypothetical protein
MANWGLKRSAWRRSRFTAYVRSRATAVPRPAATASSSGERMRVSVRNGGPAGRGPAHTFPERMSCVSLPHPVRSGEVRRPAPRPPFTASACGPRRYPALWKPRLDESAPHRQIPVHGPCTPEFARLSDTDGMAFQVTRCMKARRRSRCPLCGGAILPGQMIGLMGIVHQWCHISPCLTKRPAERVRSL